MPSVTYMNQSAPFWDFIASLEQQGSNHPVFSQNRNHENESVEGHEEHHDAPPFGPFGWGNFFGGRGFPHRGPHSSSGPSLPHRDEETREKDTEKNSEKLDEETRNNGQGPSGNSGSDNEGCAGGQGRRGRCGGRRRGHHGPGSPQGFGRRHGPPQCGSRGFGRCGGWGPRARGGLFGGGLSGSFDPSILVAQLWDQFNDTHPFNANANTNANDNDNEDHTPDADVFDTESAYVVHISLPGAKKEDVSVNWNAEKNELSLAGVIYRPGDEEFLKTLAMSERKVGPFERKIRLGTRATPAHIDVDGITAKLEDGVLRVEVPKLDSGYVEVRKVDVE